MRFLNKIVLHCPNGFEPRLADLVRGFIRDGVLYVGVVGKDCSLVEETIDELVVGDGTREYDMTTSSHPGETLQEAVEFARALTDEFNGDVQVVEL